ncbi:hypothetical protein [Cryptosporangium aurantiacum]|uniref:Uncharacterized protein n=1 Tax=Cryptosporangium aurantiacum TaxID=134849 RepID=A0A1M7PC26_9ACTN|nr:hypothetical protein [Cryptosporangium aurantiacum]SHN14411.1 hypothetical protein SAMN05443668_103185 [Cryptosporangium aurantiacum]
MIALGGCGVLESVQHEARDAATRFAAAVDARQMSAACVQLAPATRTELESDEQSSCPEALQTAKLPPAGSVGRVDVYGQQARVVFDGDTFFLTRTSGGWKITAAGCRLQSGEVYDCTVKGR